jgi:hypothetical protein
VLRQEAPPLVIAGLRDKDEITLAAAHPASAKCNCIAKNSCSVVLKIFLSTGGFLKYN